MTTFKVVTDEDVMVYAPERNGMKGFPDEEAAQADAERRNRAAEKLGIRCRYKATPIEAPAE